MKSYIHIIRHGSTQGLEERWFYGAMDISITETGFKEIEENKRIGIYPNPKNAKYYTSDMVRAIQTMNAIYDNPKSEVIPEIRELNFGDWEGLHYSQVKDWKFWEEWSFGLDRDIPFPNGDSAKSFSTRVKKGFNKILEDHFSREEKDKEADTIIVCHGGAIAVIMEMLFPGVIKKDFFAWCPESARGYTVEFEDRKAVNFKVI